MFGQGLNLVTKGMVVHKPCTLFTKGVILCDYNLVQKPSGGSSYRSPVGKTYVPKYKEISLQFTFSGDTKTTIKKKYNDISVKDFDMITIREDLNYSQISVLLRELSPKK